MGDGDGPRRAQPAAWTAYAWVFAAEAAAAGYVLWLDLVPGRLSDFAGKVAFWGFLAGLFLSPIWIGIAAAVVATARGRAWLRRVHARVVANPVKTYAALAAPVVVAAVAVFDLPERAAFRLWRDDFDRVLVAIESGETVEGRTFGPYEIGEALTWQGCTYVGVFGGDCGLMDLRYGGFCVRPPDPFDYPGAYQVSLRDVAGDWFMYTACEDF